MIIGSVTPPPSTATGNIPSSVIPQTTADLSKDDGQLLTDLGIPPDKWNNLNALQALYKKSKDGVLSVQVSRPGMELSRSYVLEQIEFVLRNAKWSGNGSFKGFRFVTHATISFQLFSTTMAMVGGILVTGVSEMASSPSEILLIST